MLYFFYEKIIKIICAIFIIVIKDLKMHFIDKNLFMEKSIICFGLLAQKKGQVSK